METQAPRQAPPTYTNKYTSKATTPRSLFVESRKEVDAALCSGNDCRDADGNPRSIGIVHQTSPSTGRPTEAWVDVYRETATGRLFCETCAP